MLYVIPVLTGFSVTGFWLWDTPLAGTSPCPSGCDLTVCSSAAASMLMPESAQLCTGTDLIQNKQPPQHQTSFISWISTDSRAGSAGGCSNTWIQITGAAVAWPPSLRRCRCGKCKGKDLSLVLIYWSICLLRPQHHLNTAAAVQPVECVPACL